MACVLLVLSCNRRQGLHMVQISPFHAAGNGVGHAVTADVSLLTTCIGGVRQRAGAHLQISAIRPCGAPPGPSPLRECLRLLRECMEQRFLSPCNTCHPAGHLSLSRIANVLTRSDYGSCVPTGTQATAAAISKAALDGRDPRASEAVDMFLSILGAEAGHMGLRLLAKGGVYICGGIAPKVPPSVLSARRPTSPSTEGLKPAEQSAPTVDAVRCCCQQSVHMA